MPLLVGQRINGEGSRRAKRLLLAGDYDGIVAMAREQLDAGADVIDVCVALRGEAQPGAAPGVEAVRGVDGEAERMAAVVRRLAAAIDAPVMIDSHHPQVLARGLEAIPGRHAIINSVNLQHGSGVVEETARLALRHGAAIVALCIDESGMARTAAHKLDVARRLFEIVVSGCRMPATSLYLDPLVFALPSRDAAWAASAVDTLEALRIIKEAVPGVRTIAGISDVSFGLKPAARAVLNAVFLHHCTIAGLDAAIVEPTEVRAYAEVPVAPRDLADAVLFNRAADAVQRYAAAFEP
jgi:5-methyltetrahydrofolate--homocysteine methyltransferase